MRVLVVDGQGGGLGKALVDKLRSGLPREIEVAAAGTNALATSAMLKGGADEAATGENAIVYNAPRADVIVGGIGILAANAMMGEISPTIAAAVSSSDAVKVLVPVNRCAIRVAGVEDVPLPVKIERAVQEVKRALGLEG